METTTVMTSIQSLMKIVVLALD